MLLVSWMNGQSETSERYEKRTRVACAAEELYDWHLAEGAFEELNPPWEPVTVSNRPDGDLFEGCTIRLRIGRWPFRIQWVARHEGFVAGRSFRDVQEAGPFRLWRHTHQFEPISASSCWMVDSIEYRFPLHAVAKFIAGPFVRRKLERMFTYRHERLLARFGGIDVSDV